MIASEASHQAGARVREHVPGLAEVDLPDDVRRAEAGDDERRADAQRTTSRQATASTGAGDEARCGAAAAAAAAARLGARRSRGEHRARAVGRAPQLAEDVARPAVHVDRAHALDRERHARGRDVLQRAGRRDEEADAGAADDGDRSELVLVHLLAERRRDRERVRVDAERDAAELGVVAAADARGQLRDERALLAEQHLRRRRPVLDAEGAARPRRAVSTAAPTSAGSSSAGHRCASGTPNAGGGACTRSVIVSGTKRPSSENPFTVSIRRPGELLDEAVVAARLRERVGGDRGESPRRRARAARRARRSGRAPRRRPG